MDAGSLVGILGGGAGGLAAIAAGVREYFAQKHKQRQEDNESALKAWREIVDRQQKDLDREQEEIDLLKRHAGDLQHALGLLFDAISECEMQRSDDYNWMTKFHELATQVVGAKVPPLPERPRRRAILKDLEFLRKSMEQNTTLAASLPVAQPAQASSTRPTSGGAS